MRGCEMHLADKRTPVWKSILVRIGVLEAVSFSNSNASCWGWSRQNSFVVPFNTSRDYEIIM